MSGSPPPLGVPVDQLGRERVAPTVSSTPANQPVVKSSTLDSSLAPMSSGCDICLWRCDHQKLRVLASSTTFIVDTSAAVAASMVAQWQVAATVQLVLFSIAAFVLLLPSNSVRNERYPVKIRRAAAMISPPMLAQILSAEVDSVHGAESSSAKRL